MFLWKKYSFGYLNVIEESIHFILIIPNWEDLLPNWEDSFPNWEEPLPNWGDQFKFGDNSKSNSTKHHLTN